MKIAILFVFVAALTGCVTAGDLRKQVLLEAQRVDLAVEKDQCPTSASPRWLSLHNSSAVAATAASASLKKLDSVAVEFNSNFALGIELIRTATGQSYKGRTDSLPAAESSSGDILEREFEINLAQFQDDLGTLDEKSIPTAMRARQNDMVPELIPAGAAGDSDLTLQRKDFGALAIDVSQATAQNAWLASFADALGAFTRKGGFTALVSNTLSDEQRSLLQEVQTSLFLAAYFKAYFRNGKIFAIDILDEGLRNELKAKLKKQITDEKALSELGDDIDGLIDNLVDKVCEGKSDERCFGLGLIGEQTFVTRSGKSYGFPGVTASIDPFAEKKISTNKIDSDAVIGDLVRVFIEAMGDAHWGVPGDANSTACSHVSAKLCGSEDKASTLAKVNDSGDRAEGAAKTISGMVLRGGWLFALNNEALASWAETTISVSVRKRAEYSAWKRETAACVGAADRKAEYQQLLLTFK